MTTFENGIYRPGLLGPLLTHANAAVLLTAVTVYGMVTSPTGSGNAQRLIKRPHLFKFGMSMCEQNLEMKEDQKHGSPI
jgi:hypothetical protein